MGFFQFFRDFGKIFNKNFPFLQRTFESASKGKRLSGMTTDRNSPTKGIGHDVRTLRERSVFLYKNTAYAKKAINSIANGVVGTGIVPTFFIPEDTESAKKRNKKQLKTIKDLWELWADSTKCDFNGRLTFSGINKLVVKSQVREGEVLILRRRVPFKENPLGLQLQVLPMEYLAEYINYERIDGGGWVYNGIEYNNMGKVVAYYLHPRHPSDWWLQPNRILASEVIHVAKVDFAGQNRGIPAGANVIIRSRDLDEYNDASLMGKKVQAAYAVFVTNNDPLDKENANDEDYDRLGNNERILPGTSYRLFPGEQVQFASPPTSQGDDSYRKSVTKEIAAGWEVSYEQMSGDFSEVNFSSGRMGWIEHSRVLDDLQWITHIPQFNDKVAEWFLEQVLIAPGGLVELPANLKVRWTVPKREMLDQTKETNAMINQMQAGLKSYSGVLKEMGENPDEVFDEIKADYEKWKLAGLKANWNLGLEPKPVQGDAPQVVQ